MNRWKIPGWLEREVIERDRCCVYCGVEFAGQQRSVARCCIACNSSKGTKKLAQWLESPYCENRGITRESVARVVQAALQTPRRVGRVPERK
jgi:hypothetical protein